MKLASGICISNHDSVDGSFCSPNVNRFLQARIEAAQQSGIKSLSVEQMQISAYAIAITENPDDELLAEVIAAVAASRYQMYLAIAGLRDVRFVDNSPTVVVPPYSPPKAVVVTPTPAEPRPPVVRGPEFGFMQGVVDGQ